MEHVLHFAAGWCANIHHHGTSTTRTLPPLTNSSLHHRSIAYAVSIILGSHSRAYVANTYGTWTCAKIRFIKFICNCYWIASLTSFKLCRSCAMKLSFELQVLCHSKSIFPQVSYVQSVWNKSNEVLDGLIRGREGIRFLRFSWEHMLGMITLGT